MVSAERVLSVDKKKNFIDESSRASFRGQEMKQKSENRYCYKCLKFEKCKCVCSGGSKMLLRKKYKKNLKIMRFFRGSHFILVGWHNMDFCIFYHGIASAYPELPIQVEIEIRLSIKMRPLGAPRPPATKTLSRRSKKNRFSILLIFLYMVWIFSSSNIGYVRINVNRVFVHGTGNSFPMLIFKNFKKVEKKKWNSYLDMA